MPIASGAITYTMTDAEFIALNEGLAAPAISPLGQFANIVPSVLGVVVPGVITAASAAGVTTVTLNAGFRNDYNISTLAQRLRRGAQIRGFIFTP